MADHLESPSKRRRIIPSLATDTAEFPEHQLLPGHPPADGVNRTRDVCQDDQEKISISATSKHAEEAVAPFLAKHIPDQYGQGGGLDSSGNARTKDPNTKYCYRHRPDLKCRRQANEPSMDQLQHELDDLSEGDKQAIAHVWSLFSAAPAKHRNLMLQGILSQCCFPQLSYLSTNVRDLIRIDFMTSLPPELSYKILCSLDTTSLCKAAQVSRSWRSLADDDVVWHRMCEQHIDRKCTKCGWGLPLLERKRLRASKRRIQLRATGQGLNDWSPNITPYPEAFPEPHDSITINRSSSTGSEDDSQLRATPLSVSLTQKQLPTPSRADNEDSYFQPRTRPWKDVYKDRFRVGTNWRYGRCTVKIFKSHTNGITCLQFDESLGILATGSYDATIKIWNLESGEEIRTLKGHTSGLRCLQFDNSKLISGSIDRTVRVWNWRTGECIGTHSGHTGGIVSLHFDSPTLLATGSMDHSIKIWNFEDKSTITLRAHEDWVNAVKVDSASRTLLSASDDCTAKLWDLDTKSVIKTFKGHVGQVQQIVALPHDFEFEDAEVDDNDGSSSTKSTQYQSAQSPQISEHHKNPLHEPYGPGFENTDRPLPPRYILTGALDSTIRLWDTYQNKSLRTYFGHIEGIFALAADSLRIVSGASDAMVKVWDPRSGKCERTFTGHAGPVSCIALSDARMCTGGDDCEVRMYSF